MREYGRVYSAFWTSPDIQELSDDAKLLTLYLLSGPHGTIAGVFRMPDGYVCEDLGWSAARVSKGFAELSRKGFANRCETTKWAWIRKFLEWNAPENPNQWKAARKIAASVPDQCAWKADFSRVFALSAGDPIPSVPNPSETVPQPLPKPLPTQEQDQEQEQDIETDVESADSTAKVFDHWRSTWNHPLAKLDAKRKRVIRDALKLYGAEILCRSISGYLKSPHHTGQNDRKTVYDDIGLLLRDAKHIEAGLEFAKSEAGGITWR